MRCSARRTKAEAIPTTAQIADPGLAALLEGDHAGQDQDRSNGGNVEGQQLNDQGGTDIGAEHDSQGRHQIDDPAGKGRRRPSGRCGAALQQCGHTKAGEKRLPATGRAQH